MICPCCGAETPSADITALSAWTPGERKIIELLARHGRVHNDRLAHALWGDDPDGGPEDGSLCIRMHIRRMRRKIERLNLPIRIETQTEFGYALRNLP